MKQGKTLQQLAAEVKRQAAQKRDFVVDTASVVMDAKHNTLHIDNVGAFKATELAHRQLADRLGIPWKYYEKMQKDSPALLNNNVNHWLWSAPEQRMIRTLDGQARAVLSNRYRRLDNYDLLEAVLPILSNIDSLKIASCDVTETRLYLKALSPKTEGTLAPNDVVQAGIVISNSEVGLGAFKVEPLVYRLVCKNGVIIADYRMQKYHVGRRQETEVSVMELFSDETLEADDRAFWLKARDIVTAALSEKTFQTIVKGMREAAGQKITGDPAKAVQELSNKFQLNQTESSGLMRHLIEGADLSRLGMLNAVTRLSQDVDDYDRATDLERMGGRLLTLAPSEWKVIAEEA